MEIYRYPRGKIENSDDYLRIAILQYQAPKVRDSFSQRTSSESLAGSTPSSYIYLPIPQSIEDTNAVDWGDDSLNSLAAYAVGAGKNVIEDPNFMKGLIDQLKSAAGVTQDFMVSGNGQSLATSFFASQAANLLGANTSIEGLISRSSGQVINPNMELLFKGVKLRSFTFTYDLVARDRVEATQIKNIIMTLKRAMAPRKSSGSGGAGGGFFISAPNVFQLTYMKGPSKHPFLHTFKPSALLNMTVDYTASQTYATYSDATPVHMRLTMTFQELNPVYFEDYNDSDAQIGVGY